MEDQKLTDHFTLYHFTHTDHDQYQAINRQVDSAQIAKLVQVGTLWETAWSILEVPAIITSGYRCPSLNQAVGSSVRSQHLLCEAADGIFKGMEVAEAFKRLRTAAKEGKLRFGQMIYEKAARGYSGGVVEWIHLSLGAPWRQYERSGQILTMVDGAYQLLETVAQPKGV